MPHFLFSCTEKCWNKEGKESLFKSMIWQSIIHSYAENHSRITKRGYLMSQLSFFQ